MTASEQQRALDQARARIEQNLAEIAALSTDPATLPKSFFPRFLDLTLSSLDAIGGAIWAIDGNSMQRIAEVSFHSNGYGSARQKVWIDAVLSQTVTSQKPCIVAVNDVVCAGGSPPEGEIGNEVPHPIFYIPVLIDGVVRLVLQVWLKHAGDPRTYGDITAFLLQLGSHAAGYLRGMQRQQLTEQNERGQQMVRFQSELLGELDPSVLCGIAANFLVDLVRCDLACVFRRRGKKWVLASASNQEVVDPKAVHSRALSDLADRLEETFEGAVSSMKDEDNPISDALAAAGMQGLCWCHARSSKGAPADYLLMGGRHSDSTTPGGDRETVAWTAGQLSKALDAATHFHHIPLRPLVSITGRTFRAWNQNRRRKVLSLVLVPAILIAGVLFVPMPWKISADCTVMPSRLAVVVAQTSGKVVEILAKEGQIVEPEQVLARMDETDFLTQLAVSRQQLLRWQVEAGKAQAMNNEAERKIAELAVKREEEVIRRLEFLRSRTQLRSPMQGIILTRDLHNREGEALEVGKPFCEIGSLDTFDLKLDLKQKDLGAVLGALEEKSALPVEFILHSHSHVSIRAEISGSDRVSQLPEARKQDTVFTARIPFPEGSELDGVLKPGYTGKAKILLGNRPLWFLMTRPFLQYWKMNWGV